MKAKPPKATYTCEACGGVFNEGWSEDEARAESREVFGTDITTDPTMAKVCDDCYKAITAAIPPKKWACLESNS